jgi:excisionase family DNA binding protein
VNLSHQERISGETNTRKAAKILDRLPAAAAVDSGQSNSRLEPYVQAQQGAAFLRIHPKTLMRLAREGSVPAYSFSEGTRRHWRFLISELDKWMKTKVNSSAHPVRSVSHEGRR